MIEEAAGDPDKVRFIDANGEEIQPTDEEQLKNGDSSGGIFEGFTLLTNKNVV